MPQSIREEFKLFGGEAKFHQVKVYLTKGNLIVG